MKLTPENAKTVIPLFGVIDGVVHLKVGGKDWEILDADVAHTMLPFTEDTSNGK